MTNSDPVTKKRQTSIKFRTENDEASWYGKLAKTIEGKNNTHPVTLSRHSVLSKQNLLLPKTVILLENLHEHFIQVCPQTHEMSHFPYFWYGFFHRPSYHCVTGKIVDYRFDV